MDAKLLIDYMNAKVGWESECKPTAVKHGLHVDPNDHALKLVNFASVNTVLISSIMLERKNKNTIPVNHQVYR
jgi:hypothetical protein